MVFSSDRIDSGTLDITTSILDGDRVLSLNCYEENGYRHTPVAHYAWTTYNFEIVCIQSFSWNEFNRKCGIDISNIQYSAIPDINFHKEVSIALDDLIGDRKSELLLLGPHDTLPFFEAKNKYEGDIYEFVADLPGGKHLYRRSRLYCLSKYFDARTRQALLSSKGAGYNHDLKYHLEKVERSLREQKIILGKNEYTPSHKTCQRLMRIFESQIKLHQ